MPDAYWSATVSTNFGEIYIPQTTDTFDVGENYSAYLFGVEKPMSVINLQGVYNRLPLYDRVSMNTLSVGGTWDEVNTQAFLDAKDDFAANVYFLWGSIEKGGFFFLKDENGFLRAGCVYGWTKTANPNDPEGEYHYQYAISCDMSGQGAIPMTSTNYVGIACTGTTTSTSPDHEEGARNWETPDFSIYTAGLGSPATYIDAELVAVRPFAYDVRYTTVVNADNLIQCVSNKDYYTQQLSNYDKAPQRIWHCSRRASVRNFYQNTDIWEIQGSWSGGKDIDTGIDPYDPGNTSTPNGDPGSYPTQSDTELPGNPNASGVDAIGTGFITLYNPTPTQVKQFNDYLFSDSITDEIANQLKKLIADPIDYLVFIAMCRFQPVVSYVSEEITFCGISTGVFARPIPAGNQFHIIDYGKIDLTEPTCSFMDYSPYSKISIYIPYVGFRDLPNDEVMGGKVGLKYHIDLLTGSFCAFVTVERPTRRQFPGDATPDGYNTIVAQYEGNCFEMLPLSSTDFRNIFSGMLGVASGVGQMVGGNMIGGLGSMASGVLSMKANVNRSGQASGSYGYGGKQDAYILITRPFQSIPSNFGGYEGYPSNINMTISDCAGSAAYNYNDGYVETDENTVWGTDIGYTYNNTTIVATDGEIAEIQELFNKGVIVNV